MAVKENESAAERAHAWYMGAQAVLVAHPNCSNTRCGNTRCGKALRTAPNLDLRDKIQPEVELLRRQAVLVEDQKRIRAQQKRALQD